MQSKILAHKVYLANISLHVAVSKSLLMTYTNW
jgi:hypothetical protein